MKNYSIRETCGLFGDFFGDNRLSLILSDTKIKANSEEHAIKRYMSNYRRKYKRKNEHERESYDETTSNWGRIMVTNEKGFMSFFK